MGNAGSDYGRLRTALKTGGYEIALNLARSLPHVDTLDALYLTILAAEKDPERYEAMAVRWIVRVLQERWLTLHEVGWMVERLRDIREGRIWEAGPALERLLEEKLRRTPGS